MKIQIWFLSVLIGIGGNSFGCGSRKTLYGSPETGITMSYHQSRGSRNLYNVTIESSQSAKIFGNNAQSSQTLTADITHSIETVFDTNIIHSLTFNDIAVSIQGDFPLSINTDNIKNRKLMITTGKRGDNPEVTNIREFSEKLNYNMASIAQMFIPELSPDPVIINDAWTSTREMDIQISEMFLNIHFTTVFNFAGIDTVMDYECMKILGNSQITISGESSMQGITIDMNGSGMGTSEYSFAYKEGKIVEGYHETVIEIKGSVAGMEVDIPIRQKITGEFVFVP